ncbi:MAG TPA: hypothetical protein VEI07_19195 [Planctomycetaceae bacterium]|nr:hypothetical protein [Planctomycetaceae bacterium]
MSDPNALNDPELNKLERQLSSVRLAPMPSERERLLYACGQAAGRAQMRRRARGTTAVAVVLGCACAGLAVALALVEQPPRIAALDSVPPLGAKRAGASQEQVLPDDLSDVARRGEMQLTVGASVSELTLAEVPQESVDAGNTVARLAAEPVLTTVGPLPIEL